MGVSIHGGTLNHPYIDGTVFSLINPPAMGVRTVPPFMETPIL